MMPQPISATDAVSPAIETTKWMMFKPFQWSRWWRVGLIGLAAGEMASGGGCGGNFGDLFSGIGKGTGDDPRPFQLLAGKGPFAGMDPATIAAVVAVLFILIMALVLIHLYLGSVCRFILFDGLLTGSFRIRQGFAKWGAKGFQFFLFMLFFHLVMLIVMGIVIGLPMAIAYSAGVFKPGGNPLALLGSFLLILPIFFVLWLVAFCFFVLVKDFAVPMMALENLSVRDAISRALSMAKSDKIGYAGYLGIKAALSVAAAFVMGIIGFIVILILLIPVIGIVVGGIALGPEMWKTPAGIAMIVTLFLVVLLVLVTILAIIGAPMIIFFQSYVVHFFSRRYPPLWNRMYPPPPEPLPPEPYPNPDGDMGSGMPPGEPESAI